MRWVLLAFAVLVIALAAVAVYNTRLMNRTLDEGIEILKRQYSVKPASGGEFENIKINALMRYKVQRYEVEGLGNLCVMKMNAGIMQMSTFVLTPYEKDLPMLSTDFIYMLGTRKGYIEFYDLTENKEGEDYSRVLAKLKAVFDNYSALQDFPRREAWYESLLTVDTYKSAKLGQDKQFQSLFTDSLKAYVEASLQLEPLQEPDRAAKLQIIRDYCADMVEKGGVATDAFKKKLGTEATEKFFGTVFFGPDNYTE